MLHQKLSKSSKSTSRIKLRRLGLFSFPVKRLLKILPLVVFIVFSIYIFNANLEIKNVNCFINQVVCDETTYNLFQSLKGKKIISLKQDELETQLKYLFPFDSLQTTFSYPNSLNVNIKRTLPAIPITLIKSEQFPELSFDRQASASESAFFRKPSDEIELFVKNLETSPNQLWSDGNLSNQPGSTASATLVYQKLPHQKFLSKTYQQLTLLTKYIQDPKIFIMGERLFLRQSGQPDIIVYVEAESAIVETSLQSLDLLYKIKKDAKVINLSFKHPIIK